MRVVPDEGPPGLAVLSARTDGPHVLLDRPLAHADAELEQFAADPFGAPQPVGSGHGVWCEKAAEARSVLVESPK